MGIIRKLFPTKIDLYESIDDLPIYNWFKINETNDLSWLIRGKKIKVDSQDQLFLHKKWDSLTDEFFNEFGIPEKMLDVLELRRDIFVLKCELRLNNDRTLLVFIEIKELELKELLASDKKESTGQVKVYVEKYLNRHLEMKKVTVKEFYEYIAAMKIEAKQQANER